MKYTLQLLKTGAVRKTPKRIINSVLKKLNNNCYSTVVEIGAGNGEITRLLVERLLKFNQYYALEIDDQACQFLKKEFPDINVYQTNAFDLEGFLTKSQKINLFISSIPLSFYSKSKVADLLFNVKKQLEKNGEIIIIFSAAWLIPFLKKQLPNSKINFFFTFPPYFTLHYRQI